MRRAAKRRSCGSGKRGAAAKPADDFEGALRLTTALHFFGFGKNTETCRGRSCSIFGFAKPSGHQPRPSRRKKH
jgi:hypothetical protein